MIVIKQSAAAEFLIFMHLSLAGRQTGHGEGSSLRATWLLMQYGFEVNLLNPRTTTLLFLSISALSAESYTLTLRQAVDLALKQNPEMIVTRLDEQKAAQSVRLARDPFYPKVVVGSGAAYSSGYPLTIDGSPPSIFQARAIQTFYNRPKTYQVAEAKETERTTRIDIDIKRDDIIFRTAALYLDAERATQIYDIVRRQIQEFDQIRQVVAARVAEGKELDVENDKAALNLARARQRAAALELDRSYWSGHSPSSSAMAPTTR